MKKRLLSALLALCMMLTMMPTAAFAVATDEHTYNDAATALAATGVIAKKTLEPNSDGTYTINLSVKGYSNESSETQQLPADVALIIDSSGSMDFCGGTYESNGYRVECNRCGAQGSWRDIGDICERTGTSTDRMYYAQDAAKQFVTGLLANEQMHVGLADFSGGNYWNDSSYYGGHRQRVELTDNSTTLINAINQLYKDHGDGTNYAAGLDAGKKLLENSRATAKFIVFISDGTPERNNGQPDDYWRDYTGTSLAQELQAAGITIITVGIDMIDGDALRAISSNDSSGNPYCYTGAAEGLAGILKQIKQTIQETINAGKNAVMTDVINTEYFELVSKDDSLATSDNETLTWDIGDITSETKTASFTVRLRDDVPIPDVEALHTNDSVELTFDSASLNGDKATFTTGAIGDPKVPVTVITLTGNSASYVYDGNEKSVSDYT